MNSTLLFQFFRAGLLAALGALCLHAGVIGSASFQSGELATGTFSSIWSRLAIGSLGSHCFASPPCTEIFSRTFTTADTGSTFTITGANSVNFPTVVALLTNGVNDEIGTGASYTGPVVSAGVGFFYTEAGSFFPSAGGPDFAGFTISDLRLLVNSVTFTPSVVPPILFGPPTSGTNGVVSATLFVDGTAIPEPGTWSLGLLSVAIAPLLFWKRRKGRLKPR